MNPVRIEIRIRNNYLFQAIMRDYPNVNQFCIAFGIHPSVIGTYINLKTSPFLQSGEYSKSAERIARLLHMLPEDLFPRKLYGLKETNAVFELPLESMDLLTNDEMPLLESVEDQYIRECERQGVRKILTTLDPREAEILKLRYGFDDKPLSLEDCALQFNVTKARIQQIEAKALKRLRSPKRLKILEEIHHG